MQSLIIFSLFLIHSQGASNIGMTEDMYFVRIHSEQTHPMLQFETQGSEIEYFLFEGLNE